MFGIGFGRLYYSRLDGRWGSGEDSVGRAKGGNHGWYFDVPYSGSLGCRGKIFCIVMKIVFLGGLDFAPFRWGGRLCGDALTYTCWIFFVFFLRIFGKKWDGLSYASWVARWWTKVGDYKMTDSAEIKKIFGEPPGELLLTHPVLNIPIHRGCDVEMFAGDPSRPYVARIEEYQQGRGLRCRWWVLVLNSLSPAELRD